jgi:hypothetical protein
VFRVSLKISVDISGLGQYFTLCYSFNCNEQLVISIIRFHGCLINVTSTSTKVLTVTRANGTMASRFEVVSKARSWLL